MVTHYFNAVIRWATNAVNGTFNWFGNLDQQGWLEVLALIAVCGFFCLRGYGSRKDF